MILSPRLGGVRQVRGDRVGELQLAAFLQQQDGHGGELLRDRTNAEMRRGGVGDIPLEVGRAVGAIKQGGAPFRDQHGAGELVRVYVPLHDFLEPRGGIGPTAAGGDRDQRQGGK